MQAGLHMAGSAVSQAGAAAFLSKRPWERTPSVPSVVFDSGHPRTPVLAPPLLRLSGALRGGPAGTAWVLQGSGQRRPAHGGGGEVSILEYS